MLFLDIKKAIFCVVFLNLSYFMIEFYSAYQIGSASLFADSIDFLEDTAINALILFSVSWSLKNRLRLSMILALLILIPGLTALWTVGQQFINKSYPDSFDLSLVGFGALIINLFCIKILLRFQNNQESLYRIAFLSAKTDILSNLAIITAGIFLYFFPSIWPDILVALCIVIINFDASFKIYKSVQKQRKSLYF
ncbi:MAG: cation transporter [Alphaproteobacteria bacterium]